MTTPIPAISPLALPDLEWQLSVEIRRAEYPGSRYGEICGDARINLERQIEAAKTGAETWTDVRGSVWNHEGRRVGGVPALKGQSHTPRRFMD